MADSLTDGAMQEIRIGQLETAINRARANAPAQGAEAALSRDVSLLAGIYGRLIYLRHDRFDADSLEPEASQALRRWLDAG